MGRKPPPATLPPDFNPVYIAPTGTSIGNQTNPQFGGKGPTVSVTGVPTPNLGALPETSPRPS